MLLLMYDDLFAVMRFIGREIPSPMWFLVFLGQPLPPLVGDEKI